MPVLFNKDDMSDLENIGIFYNLSPTNEILIGHKIGDDFHYFYEIKR